MRSGWIVFWALLVWPGTVHGEEYPFTGAFGLYPHDETRDLRRSEICLSSFYVQTSSGRYRSYVVDLTALAEDDRLSYDIHEEGQCAYDAASRIDGCTTTYRADGRSGTTYLSYDPENFDDTPVHIANTEADLLARKSGPPQAQQVRCPIPLEKLLSFASQRKTDLRPDVIRWLLYSDAAGLIGFHNIIRQKLRSW